MKAELDHLEILRGLLETQLLAVLATHGEGAPYASLVGFAATTDLDGLLFTTARTTRKYANLTGDPRASMLVDNRSNRSADFTEAAAATAVGVVEEVGEANRVELETLFLGKHPHLESFVRSPTSVLLRLRVSTYYVVTQFQHVIEIHLDR